MNIKLLPKIKTPELTTSMLLGILSDYKDPRKKISSLTKNNFLIPVKQGVYITSHNLGLRSYSLEILANLIYAPSYISLESALSTYGFIPEKTTSITSVCLGKGKKFSTSIGSFEYFHLKNTLYSKGVILYEIFEKIFCLHASPEKCLFDFLYFREKKGEFLNQADYFDYIIESYRLDLSQMRTTIDKKKLKSLSRYYTQTHIIWFTDTLLKVL